jgi:anti-anti-sigma regulatory factor
MHMRQLEVFHSRSDGSEVIACHGWVDSDTCDELQRVLDVTFEEGVQRLRLDLWNVLGIDEAGIRCLLATAERCEQSGTVLEFELSPAVRTALATSAVGGGHQTAAR